MSVPWADTVEREAIKNTEENGIVFIDEIDKIIDVHRLSASSFFDSCSSLRRFYLHCPALVICCGLSVLLYLLFMYCVIKSRFRKEMDGSEADVAAYACALARVTACQHAGTVHAFPNPAVILPSCQLICALYVCAVYRLMAATEPTPVPRACSVTCCR